MHVSHALCEHIEKYSMPVVGFEYPQSDVRDECVMILSKSNRRLSRTVLSRRTDGICLSLQSALQPVLPQYRGRTMLLSLLKTHPELEVVS